MFGHSKWEGLQNISILSVSRPKGLAVAAVGRRMVRELLRVNEVSSGAAIKSHLSL